MRNKRTVGVLLILVIVLALGVGYALEATNLTISGNAFSAALADNFIVRFKNADNAITVSDNRVTATRTDDTKATIKVTGLQKAGESATATYTIENASNGINADVKAAIVSSNTEYFSVTTEQGGINTESDTSIISGEENTITIKVTLIKTPIADQSADITVTLTATPVAQ